MKNRLNNMLSADERMLQSRSSTGLADDLRTDDDELSGLQYFAKRSIPKFIVDHPVLSFGAAIAAGISLGWWVKRT